MLLYDLASPHTANVEKYPQIFIKFYNFCYILQKKQKPFILFSDILLGFLFCLMLLYSFFQRGSTNKHGNLRIFVFRSTSESGPAICSSLCLKSFDMFCGSMLNLFNTHIFTDSYDISHLNK